MAKQTVMQELCSDVKDIKKLMNGNGQVGLCETVRDHGKRLFKIENDKFGRWFMRIGVGACTILSILSYLKQFGKL